ncbi:DNA damage checkpoint control protein MEC3 [Candida viswanathii]|uniref:DNA damage checkpoint control protein MEC3 n=1 Tax=Candida viswanathii TaxID=5486 RepID=A0A367XL95_9ASCO|nr:DNA damage checkpoint control protein MEC3 [Candida viswanathii]
MRLKLMTRNPEPLKETLSLIAHVRKFIILKFTNDELTIILVNGQTISLEPQVWCKVKMSSLFESIIIESKQGSAVLIELNVDLLLQTLRNFDKANSEGLNLKLQRTETSGKPGVNTKVGRTASLALYYSNLNINANVINHTFKIPAKIVKDPINVLHEPQRPHLGFFFKMPHEFVTMFKRLEKFKKTPSGDLVTIKASKLNKAYLGFILEEEGKYKVTLSWNGTIEVAEKFVSDSQSSEDAVHELRSQADEDYYHLGNTVEQAAFKVKLKDWQLASKIVGRCKDVVLDIGPNDCSLHCDLDGTGDVEIAYFINGYRSSV